MVTFSATEERARLERIKADPVARAVHDTIEALPHAQRLYPDLYAERVADAVRSTFESTGT